MLYMFKREFKINFKSLLVWTLVLVGLFILVFAIYPSISNASNKDMLDQMISMFPKEMMEMFNMDIVSFTTAFGWFQTEGGVFLLIIGGIYAANLGSNILIKEESDKTIEYLYSKPVSRNKIVTAKILCGLVNIVIFTVVVTAVNFIALSISNDIIYKMFFMLSFAPLLIYLAIFFITMLIATFFNKAKKVMGLGIAFALVSYFLQIIGGMADKISFIKYFSVFELAPLRTIIQDNSLDIVRMIIGLGVISISIFFIYLRYNKKELV